MTVTFHVVVTHCFYFDKNSLRITKGVQWLSGRDQRVVGRDSLASLHCVFEQDTLIIA